MEKTGLEWEREDWEGVEIWKLGLRRIGTGEGDEEGQES